jgi:hypothetical protein
MELAIFLFSSTHPPSARFLLRKYRVAPGSGLSYGLITTIKYVRPTASGAAGSGLGFTIKFLRRTRNGTVGNGQCTTVKYM